MSEIKLTPDQLAATENSGGPLLVSAAAGSGKTKVLVERLLKKVMEPNSQRDVDDFLIITYTNAAASELRGKILDSIFERISDDPENKRLRRQADICGRAEIGTIHSFCAGIIRENAHILELNPDFRIADDSESSSIKDDVLSDLLDEYYDANDSGFYMLADTMGAGRDDSNLLSIILDTHVKLLSHPYPEKWVSEQLEILNNDEIKDLSETVWGQVIMRRAKSWAEYWTDKFKNILGEASAFPDFVKAYGPSMESTFSGLLTFKSALNSGWDKAREAVSNIEFPRPKALKGFDEIKAARNELKDSIKKMSELFCDSSDKALGDMRHVSPAVSSLLKLVLDFDKRYSQEKRRRGILDFSDQEHLALKLLIDSNTGEPTEIAKNISHRFVEIMVDEYQDVNAIQEMIFGAVSRNGKNIFMVGDVKQSIYRFRLADPTIFLGKYNTFKDADEAQPGEGRKIILSKNFRSRNGVLEAANYVFRNVMSSKFGDMDYTDKEALYTGAIYPDTDEPAAELDVIDLSESDELESKTDKTEYEAKFAAKRIREIVGRTKVSDGAGGMREARYGDIAILMRSPRSRAAVWIAALEAENIPVSFDNDSSFFDTIEISTVMSLLSIIDNPHQDIPLVAVMRSPIYGFSSDELASIRASDRGGDYFTAVKNYAVNDDKCSAFISELVQYREDAADMPADEFLWHILNKTKYFAYVSAMPDGVKRKKNLMTLLEYAKKFESTGYKGLFGFVSYLKKLFEMGENPSSQEAVSSDNAVTIMSIHKSKGLEFPIVFLADMTHRFNTDDSKKPLLIHPQLGAGPKFTDLTRRIEYPTIARRAVKLQITSENMSEELRVLYVAMTRAKEKLIMLCTYANAQKELERFLNTDLPIAPQVLETSRSAAEWVLMPALRREEAGALRFGTPAVPVKTDDEAWEINLVRASEISTLRVGNLSEAKEGEVDNDKIEIISEMLSWRYPYENVMNIPSKLTATELKGNFSEEETHEDAEELPSLKRFSKPPQRPDFSFAPKKLTAAQKGTAAHLVMQYADYSKCLTTQGVRDEIERLKAMRNLSQEQAEAVRPEIISSFFNSKEGQLILHAEKVWRELKFSTLVDSELLPGYQKGEKILLQGVVDCCVEVNGELVVIDFKTDYVTKETVMERAEYYKGQLDAYAIAMSKIMKKPVSSTVLYFLSAGISVTL